MIGFVMIFPPFNWFFSSAKKDINDAIESDAILQAAWVCLEQKILLPWQRDVGALELYRSYVIK